MAKIRLNALTYNASTLQNEKKARYLLFHDLRFEDIWIRGGNWALSINEVLSLLQPTKYGVDSIAELSTLNQRLFQLSLPIRELLIAIHQSTVQITYRLVKLGRVTIRVFFYQTISNIGDVICC